MFQAREVAYLLAQRGITTFDQAKEYFRPEWSQLHSPFLMQDMQQAVERIAHAIDRSEAVLISRLRMWTGRLGRFVTSYLQNHLEVVVPYIPDHSKEATAFQKRVLMKPAQGISLIIAFDCGIKVYEQVACYANELGIDFIICITTFDAIPLPVAGIGPQKSRLCIILIKNCAVGDWV